MVHGHLWQSQEILCFYGILQFITMFTKAQHWILSSDRSTQFTTSQPISWQSTLTLFSHLWLAPQRISSRFLQPQFFIWIYCPIHATCLTHLILPNFILAMLSEEYKLWSSSSLCNFLHTLVTSFLSGPHILPSTIFSKILNPWPSLWCHSHIKQ
jgi:hypothetical protein